MKLTLQERVALIYTSQGSQRKTADLLGVSHQRVGRILHAGFPELGGYVPNSRALKNPSLIDAVSAGFSKHKKMARDIARKHGLPFDGSVPIYAARMEMQVRTRVVYPDGMVGFELAFKPDGTPIKKLGDRIAAKHTHFLSNRVREAWLKAMHRSGKYYGVSIQSIINLKLYNKQAEQRHRESEKRTRTESARMGKLEIQSGMRTAQIGSINTRYVDMRPDQFDFEQVINDINDKLISKHEPATGDPGTKLASEILLQWDAKDESETKQRAARQNRRGTRRI